MRKPVNLAELVPYLVEHPMVRVSNLSGAITEEMFIRADSAGFWFEASVNEPLRFLPVNCRMGPAAAHESGVTIDDRGFTLAKFGREIRVDYRED